MEPFWQEDSDYRVEHWPKWRQALFWILAYAQLGVDTLKFHRERNPDQPERSWLQKAYAKMTTAHLRARNNIA